jgi:hypothetical protein
MVPLLLRHVLDDVGELGHLRGDERYVRVIRHPVLCGILGSHSSRATAREHPSQLAEVGETSETEVR